MKRNTIIVTILIIVIALGSIIYFNKNQNTVDPDNLPQRNDTAVDETATTTDTPTVKSYSILEVALHDKSTDCWIAIDGKVINPTEFIAKGLHPNDKILNGCGKDMTEIFKNIPKHAGPKPQEALKQYEIGVLK